MLGLMFKEGFVDKPAMTRRLVFDDLATATAVIRRAGNGSYAAQQIIFSRAGSGAIVGNSRSKRPSITSVPRTKWHNAATRCTVRSERISLSTPQTAPNQL